MRKRTRNETAADKSEVASGLGTDDTQKRFQQILHIIIIMHTKYILQYISYTH